MYICPDTGKRYFYSSIEALRIVRIELVSSLCPICGALLLVPNEKRAVYQGAHRFIQRAKTLA